MSVAVQIPTMNGHIHGVVEGVGATNGVGMENGDAVNETAGPSVRFATGLILPPPEIKSSIDRTALYVARSSNPIQFEDKIRESKRTDPKFSFLNPADPYHEYYRHRLERISAGEAVDVNGATVDENASVEVEINEEIELILTSAIAPKEPPPADFILSIPPINAVDLDVIKLTALFTAQRGRNFLASLSTREGRNYEFDFLSPNHSLFGLFNSLVEQYTRILLPSQNQLEKLKAESMDENTRWKRLELSRQHAEWERIKREKEKKKQDDKEAERTAFAEIDWHDYAIVQTIEFTVADANTELPPPMTVAEMESMTLAQKKMAVMILENTVDEVEAHRAKQAAAEADAAAAVAGVGVSVGGAGDDGAVMEESDDEDSQDRRQQQDEERRRELDRVRSGDTSGSMKIRTDYVPKLGNKYAKSQMTTCTICGQQIPVDELQEHMRIELLDPRWKSQRDSLEMRKAQASELQRGANVEASLRGLARARVDIFGTEADEEARKREEAEQVAKRKEREKVVWDGHTASKDKTLDKFQTNVNFEEQIAAIHRAKGLAPVDSSGPGIGPNLVPSPLPTLPPPPPSLPTAPHLAAASSARSGDLNSATIASGPQPPSGYSVTSSGTPTAPTPTPVVLPPLHYQGMNAPQPFGYQPPVGMAPMGMHPSRYAAIDGSAPVAGMVRTADQMEGVVNGADDIPPAKRQRVAKLPGGQYYPEQDWVNLHPHPISVQVQLPVDETKPEWKLDGSVVTLSEIPVKYFVSTLRDHIVRQTGGSIPSGRIMLSYNGKPLRNSDSLAVYNLEDEDMLTLSVRDAKKKK